jgi:hypothetical protein
MASTYSDLKIELITTGEQSGSWGTTTNTNLGTAIQEAITGRAEANFASDADLTLGYTDTNGTQVFRNLILNVTGTISATRNLIVPTINKLYIVENNTTGSQDIVVKTSAGTGITIPNGVTSIVYADGTNVVSGIEYIDTLTLGNALAVASGGTGATTDSGARTNLGLVPGTDVLAYDANLQGFVDAFTLPTSDGSDGQALVTNGAGTVSFGSAGISTGKAIAMAIVFG